MSKSALKRLLDGNKRYVASRQIHPGQTIERRLELREEQNPFAVILGCSDSRVPVELVFDQGLGDLFVVRVAGNILGNMVLASLEFAVIELKTKLLMVLGHSNCGAVRATCSEQGLCGQMPIITDSIQPIYEKLKNEPGDVVDNVAKANVISIANHLETEAGYFPKLVAEGKLIIAPAFYNIHDGKVSLLSK